MSFRVVGSKLRSLIRKLPPLPKTSWFLIGAFYLLIALVPLSSQAQQAQELPNAQPEVAGQQADQIDEKPSPPIEINGPVPVEIIGSVPVEVTISDPDADSAKALAKRAEQREIDNLIAQQGIDESSRDNLWLTKIHAILVVVGTAALVWTLKLTRDANNTAVAALRYTRKIGNAQTRAYIHLTGVRLEKVDSDYIPTITVTYKNFGQSPGRQIFLDFRLEFSPDGKFRGEELPSDDRRRLPDLGPQDEDPVAKKVPIETWQKFTPALGEGTALLLVYGRFYYQDVFGEEHLTAFRVYMHVEDNEVRDTKKFPRCVEGNEST